MEETVKKKLTYIYSMFGIPYNDETKKADQKYLDRKIEQRFQEKITAYCNDILRVDKSNNKTAFEEMVNKIAEINYCYAKIKNEARRNETEKEYYERLKAEEEKKSEQNELNNMFEDAYEIWCEDNPVQKVLGIDNDQKEEQYIFKRNINKTIICGRMYDKQLLKIEDIVSQRSKGSMRLMKGVNFARFIIRKPNMNDLSKIDEIGSGTFLDVEGIKLFAQVDEKKIVEDKKYKEFVLNELFSDEAIKLANIYTSGYVGTPILNKMTGKYERRILPEVVQAVYDYEKNARDIELNKKRNGSER